MVITPEQIAKSGSEAAHQKAFFAWAALNVGKYPQLKYLFHIPNGGSRDIREAASLKAQGVKPGVPDLFLPVAMGDGFIKYSNGLFIELKKIGGKVSKEQQEWLDYLNNNDYTAVVCYGWLEARNVILKYLNGE